VRSPEQVVLELPVAGPTSRILAYAIDAALMTVLSIALVAIALWTVPVAEWLLEIVGQAADEIAGEDAGDPSLGGAGLLLVALFIGAQLVIEIFYFVFFETVWRGASPGKHLLGLGVVGDDGLPVSFGASLVRNLLRSVDVLPMWYTTGLVAMLVSEQTRRLGDVAAGTLVIRFDRGRPVPPLEFATADTEHVPFTRQQLQRMGATERRLLRQTLRRVDTLAPAESEPLAERSAHALAERLGADAPDSASALAWLRALHAGLSRR
jgi:uncharacterized RDD family membrane protein YckC